MKRCSPPARAISRVARLEIQVIGVAEDDLGAEVDEVAVSQRLDRSARPDRHERRRLDDAVRRAQLAAPRRHRRGAEDWKATGIHGLEYLAGTGTTAYGFARLGAGPALHPER